MTCSHGAVRCRSPGRINLNTDPAGGYLRRRFAAAFEYSDCTVDDARLVVLNAMDAAERGAVIRVHTRCVRVERAEEWTLILNARGRRTVATARVLVNTTGPWTANFSEFVPAVGEKGAGPAGEGQSRRRAAHV